MTLRVKTLSWPETIAFYERLAEGGAAPSPLLELARHIAGLPHASMLHACPSAVAMRLAKTADFAEGDDELRIGFDDERRQFLFTHLQRGGDARPWSRECAVFEGAAVLERLLHKRLRWFHQG